MALTEATFEYKCRRCGQIKKGLTSNPATARDILIYASTDTDIPKSILGQGMFHTVELHYCQDGVGLADLVGFGKGKHFQEPANPEAQLKKIVLDTMVNLEKKPGNAAMANRMLDVALVLWRNGGASPVGPSTENSRWFEAFMKEHAKFPQPM